MQTDKQTSSRNSCCSKPWNTRSTFEYTMDAAANTLFGKTRQAVLVLLFEQPQANSYLREISRATRISPGALQHELNQLQQADLVLRANDGNRVTYRANTRHPIFGDLQAIIGKTCGLPSRIETALAASGTRIDYAAIYGSVAKGSNHAASDIDLLVVGSLSLAELIELIRPLGEQAGREISVRLYDKEEFRECRTKADPFLETVMSGPLIPLVGQVYDA